MGKAHPCAKGFHEASAPLIPNQPAQGQLETRDRHRVSLGLYTEVGEMKLTARNIPPLSTR